MTDPWTSEAWFGRGVTEGLSVPLGDVTPDPGTTGDGTPTVDWRISPGREDWSRGRDRRSGVDGGWGRKGGSPETRYVRRTDLCTDRGGTVGQGCGGGGFQEGTGGRSVGESVRTSRRDERYIVHGRHKHSVKETNTREGGGWSLFEVPPFLGRTHRGR